MCCCTNVKQYKTRTCNSTKSRCHKNFTWKHGKPPKLSLSMTFVACVTCHVVSYLLGAYRKHKWTDIIQNLMTFVDWERTWWTCAYTDRNLLTIRVDHEQVRLVHIFFLASKHQFFAFRLFIKQKSELSEVSVLWKVVRHVAMPVLVRIPVGNF